MIPSPTTPQTAPSTAAGTSPAPDDPRLGAWRAFLQAHARVTRRLDEELRAEHELSLAEYDALLQIASSAGRRIRMSALADRVILSRSGITRLIDRLVADGFVERASCASDARGAEAVLTRDGLDRLRAASRTHLRGIEEFFLSSVPAADLAVLERSLLLIADRAAPSTPDADHCLVDSSAGDTAASPAVRSATSAR